MVTGSLALTVGHQVLTISQVRPPIIEATQVCSETYYGRTDSKMLQGFQP